MRKQEALSEVKELEKTKERLFIIGAYSMYKLWWDVLISLIASVDSVMMPVLFSFTVQTAVFAESWTWKFLESTVDILYILDILIQFRTTYFDKSTGD